MLSHLTSCVYRQCCSWARLTYLAAPLTPPPPDAYNNSSSLDKYILSQTISRTNLDNPYYSQTGCSPFTWICCVFSTIFFATWKWQGVQTLITTAIPSYWLKAKSCHMIWPGEPVAGSVAGQRQHLSPALTRRWLNLLIRLDDKVRVVAPGIGTAIVHAIRGTDILNQCTFNVHSWSSDHWIYLTLTKLKYFCIIIRPCKKMS